MLWGFYFSQFFSGWEKVGSARFCFFFLILTSVNSMGKKSIPFLVVRPVLFFESPFLRFDELKQRQLAANFSFGSRYSIWSIDLPACTIEIWPGASTIGC